jgi:hypothetical protein
MIARRVRHALTVLEVIFDDVLEVVIDQGTE